MLKGISKVLSPELLSVLCEMGHGDEIVLADAHFPGTSIGKRVIRADGINVSDLLSGIMPLFELDQYVDSPVIMMAAVEGDKLDPKVEKDYLTQIKKYKPSVKIQRIERFDFYDRAKDAFAIVMTGETRKYGNVILKKGVTPSK